MAAKPELIKVCRTDRGKRVETPWARDLGPARGPSGSREVRLMNVPFMHAKPTWGDVIVVSPVRGGLPTWDRAGVPWRDVATRIAEDGGRWAMIVDYTPHPDTQDALAALSRTCAEHGIVCEGAWRPRGGEPGRAYLAVPNALADAAVIARLRAAALPCELAQIHPAPVERAMPAPAQLWTRRAGAKPSRKVAAKQLAAKTARKQR
jgi:hypothetical protein